MTLTKYLTGFILSIFCTLAAYSAVVLHLFAPQNISIIFALALLQFIIQLFFFLHVSFKKEDRERLVIMAAASVVVLILVSGSLWIMTTLNGRMTPSPQQMEQYMNDQGGF